jgi:hypothetical protein
MNDWTFSRPLPPGVFPDEDHLGGARPAKKREQKPREPANRTAKAG